MTPSVADRLRAFLDDRVYPNEARYELELRAGASPWIQPAVMEELKASAREAELWNLFLPKGELGGGLTNREYMPLCEMMGSSPIAPEVFNCNAPDTGNMEVLARYGSDEQRGRWLEPLMRGEIRSGFAMTEPGIGSSDATNISASIRRDGGSYVLQGRKWWTTGANHPNARVLIFMGKTDAAAPKHLAQSMIIVPIDAPGVRIVRHLPVFGFDDAPFGHCEIEFDDVRVPAGNLILGEGRGFEIAQGRLGPGRLHHTARLLGLAERCLRAMCERARDRVAFGRPLAEQGVVREWIARSRIDIDQTRHLVYDAADQLDRDGNKQAANAIAMAKVAAPSMAQRVVDRAIQTFGAEGLLDATGLAHAWISARSLRIADGPDEVHVRAIAKNELGKYDA